MRVTVAFASKQTEVVTSMKGLLKLVEASQLSPRLNGTLPHSHCDWVELHQVRPPQLHNLHLPLSALSSS